MALDALRVVLETEELDELARLRAALAESERRAVRRAARLADAVHFQRSLRQLAVRALRTANATNATTDTPQDLLNLFPLPEPGHDDERMCMLFVNPALDDDSYLLHDLDETHTRCVQLADVDDVADYLDEYPHMASRYLRYCEFHDLTLEPDTPSDGILFAS